MSPFGNTSARLFKPVASPSGTPGLGSTTRVRTHGFSRRGLFALWREFARELLELRPKEQGFFSVSA